MKILILAPYPHLRGPLPKIIPLLAKSLQSSGCEVISEGWGRDSETESITQKVVGRIKQIINAHDVLTKYKPEILLIQSAHDWRTVTRDISLLLATQGLYKRAILQIHGSSLDRILSNNHHLFKAASRLLFVLCDAIIVSSSTEKKALSLISSDKKMFIADNIYQPEPLDIPLTIPAEWNMPTDKPIIFFAGRLIPEKGVLDLLSAMETVLKNTDCHLLLAGVGPLETEVQARLTQPPLAGQASWVRYLTRTQLELAYNITKIFILPTYHNEGFPAVIQDALGHGLPIITTPNGGIADHLVDGIHVRFIPPQNPIILASTVVELLQDPSLRQKMSVANKKKAEDFSPEIVSQQYHRIFNQVLCS